MAAWTSRGFCVVLSIVLSGCVTTFGYYQDNLKSKQVESAADWVPQYNVVKHWAYDVHDGLDSRATVNHYALEFGVVFGLAAAGAMAGLAAFSGSSAALKGIPIGAAFVSGLAGYYDNRFRYDMYSRASSYVRALIDVSDERVTRLRGDNTSAATLGPPRIDLEARCLKAEVGRVIDLVKRHISLSDPANLAAELRAINSSVDQGKVADLVKAAQGDLSDLNTPTSLRETYCEATGLLPGPLEDPRPLIVSTQAVLMSLAQDQVSLDGDITAGEAERARLTAQADDLAKKGKTTDALQPTRGRIKDLQDALSAARDTLTKVNAVTATTAAGYVATLKDPATTPATRLDTASKLYAERTKLRASDQAAAAASAKIKSATSAAQDAIKAVAGQ